MSETQNPIVSKSPDQPKSDTKNTVLLFRPASQEDVGFIFNSWLKSYEKQSKVSSPIYYQFHHYLIESLLKKSTVTMAVNPSDPSQIYAYLVHENVESIPILHYTYTKHTYRKMGILTKLLAHNNLNLASGGFITHRTEICNKLPYKNLIYNPYLSYNLGK